MKLKIRHRATVLFFGLFLLICASIGVGSFAQTREGFVTEGESLDNITIGKSTMDDVIAVYGNDYKLIKHREYSYEMIYKNLGLSFYSCLNDPNKEIFSIHIQAPFKATTGKGIVLNESTFEDIFRAYGKWEETSGGFEYEKQGIYFDYASEDSEDSEETKETETQPNAVRSDEKTETTNSTVEEKSSPEKRFVFDGEEVSSLQAGDSINVNSVSFTIERKNDIEQEEESSDSIEQEESSDQTEAEKAEEKIIKAKTVKYIQLIEKSGLRQCSSKFPPNKIK